MSDSAALRDHLAAQDGVIARHQVLACGFTPNDIRRRLRRREWASVLPGVYVDHTGKLSWRQRAWAAVLDAYPAALSHSSALAVVTGSGQTAGPIHVVVDSSRRVTRRTGVIVHYRERLEQRVLWHAGPPRMRTEEALLDIAADASTDLDAIAALTDAVGGRITTADRLSATLTGRARMRRRRLLVQVLIDIRDGACSVLESGYLVRVERPHGLPRPQRQAPTTAGRPGFRDLDYPEFGLVIELDGRGMHADAHARDRDLERDLDAAVDADRRTLRIGWGQVFGRPCSTARKVARILISHGWSGDATPCRTCA